MSDDGAGMSRETMEQIFEPFFTTKEVGKGTGMGLSTVYGIVKQNDGFVHVYSEPGEGTTLHIYLVRYTGDDVEPVKPQRGQSPTGQGETVLIVEDEPAMLRLTKRILDTFGYKILTAASPKEALQTADQYRGQLDLLVTDVVMPGMNGRDLAASLVDRYPGLRVLFMSGYTADVIAHRGVLDASATFIQKPFARDALAAKVREALDTPSSAANPNGS
ncbi:MAG: response regulator [Gammaproteobacteria bacterium]|nr:response regulator [Gammaproteobacteria bacterium]